MSALHARPRRHSSKSREHGVLVAFVALVFGAVAFIPTLYYFIGTAALAQVHTENVELLLGPPQDRPPPPPVDEAGGQWVNILLLGSDTRVGANAAIGGENGEDMRNDTTIIMHVSADRSRIEFLSIPRDSMVKISACTTSDGVTHPGWFGMWNEAFTSGGRYGSPSDAAACVISTIEDTTGIRIDEYAVIDFYGFENVINAMDGVPMCIPGHIVAAKAALDLQPGPQVLNGQQALAWARLRTAEVGQEWMGINGSDLSRIDRQHELMSKVVEKALSTGILLNPTKFAAVVDATAGSLTTSPHLADFDWLMGLVWSVRHIDPAQVVFATVPIKPYPPDHNRLVWASSADAIFEAIINDQPISGVSVADESYAGPVPSPSGTTGTDGGGTTATDDLALVSACPTGS